MGKNDLACLFTGVRVAKCASQQLDPSCEDSRKETQWANCGIYVGKLWGSLHALTNVFGFLESEHGCESPRVHEGFLRARHGKQAQSAC